MAHPDPAFTMLGYTLTTKTPGVIGETIRLLAPHVAETIPASIRQQRLCLCYDGWQRAPFIWPLNTHIEGTRANGWTVSANRIWEAARKDWVCLVPANGQYLLGKPVLPVKGEPVWLRDAQGRALSFAEIMLMAFRDLYIDDPDHEEVAKRRIVIIPE
jgi:hypothetical protein